MPDEIDLMLPAPGGAESAPEGAPPAAPQPGDDAATQSASVAVETPPAPEAVVEDAPAPAPSKGVGKRIDQLVGEREREARRADQATEALQTVLGALFRPGAQPQGQPAGQSEAPPDKSKFGNDWQAYDQAVRAYEARQEARQEWQRLTAEQQRQMQARAVQEQQVREREATAQLHTVLGSQMQEAMARYPDYAEVVGSSQVDLPVRVEAAMALTGAGGLVAYHLAQHPQLIPQLARMHDMQLAHNIGRIAFALQSQAVSGNLPPPPARTSGGRGAADPGYPKDATPEQHLQWRERTAAARKRA